MKDASNFPSKTSPGLVSQTSLMTDPSGDINIKPSRMVLSPVNDRRNFWNRTFSKLDKGSLRGSIFALCASAIGSGVLSLPFVLKLCGMGLGILFICIGAIAACWSMYLIIDASMIAKVKNYSQLANKAGGLKLERLLQINILIYMFGSCISY